MNKLDLAKRIIEFSDLVQYHSDLYYNKSTPEISDAEYDGMVDELRGMVSDLEKVDSNAPEIAIGKEALNNVGATPSYGRKVTHAHIMGSLEKATSFAELHDWYIKYAPLGGCKLVVTPKVDGCASRVNYEVGKFKAAATRGDGTTGQDVTDNFRCVKNVPKTVPDNKTMELRGEVIMYRSDFADFLAKGGTAANPRNCGTGSLMQQDPNVTGERNLNLHVYDVINSGKVFQRESEKLQWLHDELVDFKVVPFQVIDINEFEAVALKWEQERPNMDYEIDGLVIALDSIEAQEDAGWNGKRPNGKIAFKFKPEQKTARVEGIDWQVGRTGRLTPMARIEPTQLAGSTIRNITLHNMARVRELAIAVGDDVLIEKAGDIIPQVVHVVGRHPDRYTDIFPEVCPACGGKIEADEGGVSLWCHNPNCPEQLSRRVLHWIKTLNVMGVGSGIVDELCWQGFVKDIVDLYFLTEDQLVAVTGGKVAAQKVQMAILEKCEIPLAVFLDALGIDGLGTTTSKDIAKTYKTLDEVCRQQVTDLAQIPGIGAKTAKSIYDGLAVVRASGMLDNIRGVIDIKEVETVVGNLSGMSFVLTGAMSKPRKVIEEAIEKAGGENKGSVSKGVTYLVQADANSTSSKTEKANKVGTKIISEDTLWNMINGIN